ncbi:E3 ubiquitin-protein ligase UPL7 isoform X2 [Vigna angularis]|uniref:E3 ubiquitin-protein ligase UPL7 isoform X2 n=1 Tax=Phaseolus angularis TaxID=3914 RepID=UPI0022B55E97|nr:E3 ubiquitin-protein ligase UPL7 isoform X2 [Vigna angularis]
MDAPRKQQVSLRGASAKEITRDALLQKVSQERELRNYAKRAAAAALFIQRVWRRFKVTKAVSLQLQQEWEMAVSHYTGVMTADWISNNLLRPFLFFITLISTQPPKVHFKRIDSMKLCFTVVLESLKSSDSKLNFCFLAIGTTEERRIWRYQARKLTFLSFVILSEFSKRPSGAQDIPVVTSLAMRILVMLTDLKGWKGITNDNHFDADLAVKDLIQFMGSDKSGCYVSIGRYISALENPSSQSKTITQADEIFFITASVITLAVRPFYLINYDAEVPHTLDFNYAAEQYILYLLTIPWLVQHLPLVLLPALKHKSILFPCFQTLLILKEKVLMEMSEFVKSEIAVSFKAIPPVGWALANIICLATVNENESFNQGRSRAATDCTDFNSSHTEPSRPNDDSSDIWDIEPMRNGPQGIPKDMFAMLHLFCATYSHLLLVLDDIEFYEKQVPFQIEQQRKIASMLNTLVYNGLSHVGGHHNKSLMDCAIRCLHLLYERDCRHPFCPPALWLSPARKSRPPIAVAARTHEVLAANLIHDDYSSASLSVGSVVTIVPHVFPFEERVEIFREFIKMDKASRKMAGEISEPGSRAIEIVIRRGHIVEDGFRQLNSLGSRLKSSIHVSFVSECGLLEAGLDYGGLSKEFLTDLSKAAFAPEYGLFSQTSTSDRLLIPTASARYLENGLQMIEFLGRVVGKALYEGILLDYSFSHVFVQKLLGRYSFLDELSTLDPELYRNLMYVKNYDGDVTELCLDFTVTEESLGKRYVVELKSGGKDISVTNENKMQYMHAMADYKLNQQMLPFSNAFYRGLTDLISPSWLKLFNASEFNQLLSGGNYDIDVDDLKNNTRYTGGYNEGSRTIKIFWEVIKGFEPQERCMLLKFVTSCSRAPLLGFKYLQPPLTIHKVACDVPLWATIGGQDVDRLPSASTCYNTLKLPTYKRPGTLRAKLLYAISSNAGFELS